MDGFLSEQFEEASLNQKAMSLWYKMNGERERIHTVAVFLKESKDGTLPPHMYVYVDSNVCVVDFNASRELYLARLEAMGLKLDGIDFRLSRYAEDHRKRRAQESKETKEELPDLTDDERKYIEKLVEELPAKLRPSVSKAISSSIRRQKAESTQKS